MIVPPTAGVTIVNSHKRLVGFNVVPDGQVEGASQISKSRVVPEGHKGKLSSGTHIPLSKVLPTGHTASPAHRGTPLRSAAVRVVPGGHSGEIPTPPAWALPTVETVVSVKINSNTIETIIFNYPISIILIKSVMNLVV